MYPKRIFFVLAILIASLTACGGTAPESGAASDPSTGLDTGPVEDGDVPELTIAPEKGALAPDFTAADLNGNYITLSEQRGKYVLLNFWATWCGPCRIEMPAIQAKYEQYTPELVVLAVDFDEPQDIVQAFVDELGLTFDVLLDPGAEIQDLYRVRGYPTTMFLDPEGVIRIIHIGAMTEKQLDGYLRDLGLIKESFTT